jgi:hypothetical protein
MITIEKIQQLQKGYRVTAIQEMIESGQCWKMEGSIGRFAMTCLEAGICFLGEKPTYDYYGNFVPARGMLELTTKGSLENAQEFWQRVEDGDFETIEALEEMFGADVEDEVE